MPRAIHEGRFRARATPTHFVTLPTEIPIPDVDRNVVPEIVAPKLRWHVCTTAPQAERRAADSLRRETERLAGMGLPPLVAYVPCATDWRERKRGSLTLPRLEVQTPKIRSYLFVGAEGGLTAEHLAVMSERERAASDDDIRAIAIEAGLASEGGRRSQDRATVNRHGLTAILGRVLHGEDGTARPHILPLPDEDVAHIAKWALQERQDAEATSYRQFLAKQAEARQEAANATEAASFEVGDTVTVGDGPFASFRGAVEGMDDANQRALISIDIFGRLTPIELDFAVLTRFAEAA